MSRILRIKINGLFGFLNHDIDLSHEGITFIHGPNGCGKTTALKLISAFFDRDFIEVSRTRFDGIEIYYEDGLIIKAVKEKKQEKLEKSEKLEKTAKRGVLKKSTLLKISLVSEDKELKTYDASSYGRYGRNGEISPAVIDELVPSLRRVGPRSWMDMRTGERFMYAEILERFADELPEPFSNKRPDWLLARLDGAKLHFVQTQRLLKVSIDSMPHREGRNFINVIELYSEEIKKKISELLAQSAAVSQSRDRSFPQRLLSMKLDESYSEDKIRSDYAITEQKIQKLMGSGLIELEKNISLPGQAFEATEKKVLSLYVEDINNKLSIFDDMLKKIETFLGVVSPKLRSKSFKVNRVDGFLIETTQGEPQKLEPAQLSSGEQHQIVLFYELIFKSNDKSFFLIDEPEISLHIDWQRQFLADVSKVARLGDHTFLVATHSPQIIGVRRDLAVALDGGILNEQ
ncbi:TPA: AAA family ATPase [Serratia marcescens]